MHLKKFWLALLLMIVCCIDVETLRLARGSAMHGGNPIDDLPGPGAVDNVCGEHVLLDLLWALCTDNDGGDTGSRGHPSDGHGGRGNA